jgi:hypothetical protein
MANTATGAAAGGAVFAMGLAVGGQPTPPVPASLSVPLTRGAASAPPANGRAHAENAPSELVETAPAGQAAGDDQQAAAQQVHVQRRADGVDVWFRDARLQPYQVYRIVGAWLSDAYANGLRPRTVTVNGSIAFSAARTAGGDGAAPPETGSSVPAIAGAASRTREKRHAG